MDDMFNTAATFNQDLSGWCVNNITSEPLIFQQIPPLQTKTNPFGGLVLITI